MFRLPAALFAAGFLSPISLAVNPVNLFNLRLCRTLTNIKHGDPHGTTSSLNLNLRVHCRSDR